MAEYNVKINVKTDTGYDQLYPKSKSDIIDFDKSNSNLSSNNVEAAIKEVNTKANTNKTNIGTLASLKTDSKTNLVGAINEVDSHANTATTTANTNKTNIGTLSSLKTSVKNSIVNAINWLYNSTIGKTLKTLDEIKINTTQGYYVDALAIKDLIKTNYIELKNKSNVLFGIARSYGNFVCITSVFANNQATYEDAGWIKIGELPSNLKPLNDFYSSASYGSNQTETTSVRVISSTGEVQAYYPKLVSVQYLTFSISYITY